jgi:hypothetical protein
MPAQNPSAAPANPNANILPNDLCLFPGQLDSTPMHAPMAAGFMAFRTDSR